MKLGKGVAHGIPTPHPRNGINTVTCWYYKTGLMVLKTHSNP